MTISCKVSSTVASPGAGENSFLNLTDSPSDYTGHAAKHVVVNGSEDGVEFSAEATHAFTDLTDSPSSYAGHAAKHVVVNGSEDGVEFSAEATHAFTDLTDSPSSYAGQASKYVAVNGTEDGVEFVSAPGGGGGGVTPHGWMRYDGVVAQTTIDTTATFQDNWYGVTGLSGANMFGGFTFTTDGVNGDYLTVPETDQFETGLVADFSGSSGNEVWLVALFLNDEVTPFSILDRKLGGGGDVGSASDIDETAMTVGDKVRVKVLNESADGKTISFHKLKVKVRRA